MGRAHVCPTSRRDWEHLAPAKIHNSGKGSGEPGPVPRTSEAPKCGMCKLCARPKQNTPLRPGASPPVCQSARDSSVSCPTPCHCHTGTDPGTPRWVSSRPGDYCPHRQTLSRETRYLSWQPLQPRTPAHVTSSRLRSADPGGPRFRSAAQASLTPRLQTAKPRPPLKSPKRSLLGILMGEMGLNLGHRHGKAGILPSESASW